MNILDLIALIPGGAPLVARAKAALERFETIVAKAEAAVADFEAEANRIAGIGQQSGQ